MAWEMQTHMEGYIIPSIEKHMEDMSESDKIEWLLDRYMDACTEIPEDAGINKSLKLYERKREEGKRLLKRVDAGALVEAIADKVCEHRHTTNGGWEVYLGDLDCRSIPWCTEEEMLQWWANQ